MKTIIRKASMADAEAIGRLFYETAIAVARELYPMPKARELAISCVNSNAGNLSFDNGHYLVAANTDNAIIGCSALQCTGEIDLLCVHPTHQGRGIASNLLERLYEFADGMHLSVLTTASNLVTFPFFEKKGFIMLGSCSQEIAGVQLTSITLAKRLWL